MKPDKHIVVPKYSGFKQELILFGDIEDIEPVKIILPDPPNKRQIINYNRATSNQKWERTPLPKSFDKYKALPKDRIYSKLNKEEHQFILGEYKKLETGVWIFNNGELVYLTDIHYFYLNWWNPDFGRPIHKSSDRNFFYHWNKVENDNSCYGLVELACRRQGKSARAGCIAYKRTFTNNNHYCGIQSKTDNDAEKFFQKTVALPWKRLPFFFQPNYDNSNNPRSELRFFSPTKRGKDSQMELGREEALESWIESRASGETAFDGEKLHTSIDDEAAKVEEADISTRWSVKKHCLEVSGRIIGKELMTTTVENIEGRSGRKFKEIWDGSNPGSVAAIGRTESGLHRHFTPAYEGYDGMNGDCIDEYGNSLIDKSKEELTALREAAKKNPAKLTELKRRFPFTIREAFRSGGKDCHFNIEIIDSRLEDFTFENKYLTWGDFRWKDDKPNTEVIFHPKPKGQGKFVVSYLFQNPQNANKKQISGGIWIPNNTTAFIAGGDPFKFKETSGKKKSQGTGVVFMNQDVIIDPNDKDINTWTTNRFVATYCNRPSSQNEYGDDMIKMCHYYGCKMFPEINVPFLWDYFTDHGYGGYLFYQKKNNHRMSVTPGANTNEGTIEAMFSEMEEYIEKHGRREVHQEILETCREVEIANLSPYDLFVACGYALLGARKSARIPVQQASTKHQLFTTYKL